MSISFLTRRKTKLVAWVQIAVLVVAVLAPSLIASSRAEAYTGSYVTSRSITMETSVASETGVIYEVDFLLGSAHTPAAIVLQYCDDSPIIGDSTCGLTRSASGAGTFDWNDSAYTSLAGDILSASTPDATNSDDNKWVLDVDTPAAMSASDRIHFSVNNVINPDVTNSSFYVRILTFASTANADAYVVGTDTNVVDGGGIALSTANAITVTAKVQETLTFCVYTGVNCAAGGSAVAIGDAVDGVIGTLDTPANTTTDMDIATNATGGAVVYMSGTLLLSGANDIDSIGNTCTAEAAGTESFGMRIDETGATNFSPHADYDCVANSYAFNTTSMDPTSTTSPYGDEILDTSSGPTDSETVTMEFDGNASNLTPAGIYTATYDLVAAATF